jgi:hypothetical protein
MKIERHSYSANDLFKIAYMAGAGASAVEIAYAIGGSVTGSKVYWIVSTLGIRLAQKSRTQTCLPLVISETTLEAAARWADRKDVDTHWLIARVFERVADNPDVLEKIVATIESPE